MGHLYNSEQESEREKNYPPASQSRPQISVSFAPFRTLDARVEEFRRPADGDLYIRQTSDVLLDVDLLVVIRIVWPQLSGPSALLCGPVSQMNAVRRNVFSLIR